MRMALAAFAAFCLFGCSQEPTEVKVIIVQEAPENPDTDTQDTVDSDVVDTDAVILPDDEYPGCDTEAVDPYGTTPPPDIMSNPIVYWDEASADIYPTIPSWTPVVTAHVDAMDCDPNFEVASVSFQVWSSDPARPLVGIDPDTGAVVDGEALVRLSVNGQVTGDIHWDGWLQGMPISGMGGVHGYAFSWSETAFPSIMGPAMSTTPRLPMVGNGTLTFELDPSVFDAQLDGDVEWDDRRPLALNISVYVFYRDTATGMYAGSNSSIQSLTINW